MYNKTDDFDFEVISLPFPESNIGYTQISHIRRFSHSYFVMQRFVVIILI